MAHPLDRIGEPLQRAGEALGRITQGLIDFGRAMIEYVAAICPPELLKIAELQAALKVAPPRVRHLALYSKKRRTRKKNINRALREYRRQR